MWKRISFRLPLRKLWSLCCIALLGIFGILYIQNADKSRITTNNYVHKIIAKHVQNAQNHTSSSSVVDGDYIFYQEDLKSFAKPVDNFNVNIELGRWDKKRLYKFFDFVLTGESYVNVSKKYNICLATQGSLERLHWIAEISDHWAGSISVSIFILGNEFSLVKFYISYMRECFPEVRKRVSFHLAFSSKYPPNKDNLSLLIKRDCDNPEQVLRELVLYRNKETTEWRKNLLYPQNHLRNQARKNCQSSYVFITDIDIIPSYGLTEEMDMFLKTVPCEKLCAYVVPVYELDESVNYPKNKSELIRASKKGLARPFHFKVYKPAQILTNYWRWEKSVNNEEEAVHVSHVIETYKPWYEPFFIVSDIAPPYDERFIGYGYTRNTQAYEMNAVGYKFYIMSPVFAIHWHLQTSKEDYNPWRRKQLYMNMKLVRHFKSEISARYNFSEPKKTNEIVYGKLPEKYLPRKPVP